MGKSRKLSVIGGIVAIGVIGGLAGCGAATASHPASSGTYTDANGVTCAHGNPATGLCPGDTQSTSGPVSSAIAAASSAEAAISSAQAAASASPTVVPATSVEFVVEGTAPGDGYGDGPTISYGSDGSEHEAQPASIDGRLHWTVSFDPSVQYYFINAQLIAGGSITCKIIVSGPSPDVPTTIAQASASGGASICDVQIAPTDNTGDTWNIESGSSP
jgi:hypothetical protein